MSSPTPSGDPQTRRRILEAVLEAVMRSEADVLNMAAVARHAGVSRQAVYLHFPNRAALGVAALQWLDEREDVAGATAPIFAASTPEAMLRAYAEFLGAFNPRIAPYVRMGYRLRAIPEMEAAWQDRLVARRNGALRIARRLHEAKRLASHFTVQSAGDLLCALASALVWEELTQDLGWSTRRYVDHLHAVISATLLTPAPSPRRGGRSR